MDLDLLEVVTVLWHRSENEKGFLEYWREISKASLII